MSSSTASNIVASLALAALITTDNGSPPASLVRWSLDPALPRSTGFAPVRSPFDRAQAERVDACAGQVNAAGRTQLVQQQRLKLIEHPGAGPLVQPPPAGGRGAAAQLLAGSSPHGVEVRAMKMIAAMQARSATVRGTPPRAREGGGGSSGWMRCHSASGRSLSARVVMSGDHCITQPGRLPHVPECPVSRRSSPPELTMLDPPAEYASGDLRLGVPRAWEAVSGWPLCGAGAGQGPWRLTVVDRWRPLGTAAWGTYRARPARTTWFGSGVASTGTARLAFQVLFSMLRKALVLCPALVLGNSHSNAALTVAV